jgi:3-deoxy-manno-octulosonate cytidylyltransferase (CMP-KDO synthetase)
MKTQFNVVIPARFASTRLPGKPLLPIAGKPMIQHVYERAIESGAADVVIATDDQRVQQACDVFSAHCCMTAADHQSGTDRIAEVVEQMQWPDDSNIVNLQGDEPLIKPQLVRQVAEDLAEHTKSEIATLCSPIHTAAELLDPHVVKVVTDNEGFALYFSRAAIPWDRDAFAIDMEELPEGSRHYRHIGLYAYKAGFIRHYSQLKPCYIEKAESLEQLRALWNGFPIHVSMIEEPPGHGVDTQQDLERVRNLLTID